jgi:hypothetical protein
MTQMLLDRQIPQLGKLWRAYTMQSLYIAVVLLALGFLMVALKNPRLEYLPIILGTAYRLGRFAAWYPTIIGFEQHLIKNQDLMSPHANRHEQDQVRKLKERYVMLLVAHVFMICIPLTVECIDLIGR